MGKNWKRGWIVSLVW